MEIRPCLTLRFRSFFGVPTKTRIILAISKKKWSCSDGFCHRFQDISTNLVRPARIWAIRAPAKSSFVINKMEFKSGGGGGISDDPGKARHIPCGPTVGDPKTRWRNHPLPPIPSPPTRAERSAIWTEPVAEGVALYHNSHMGRRWSAIALTSLHFSAQ